jgi:hypothetical protein
MAVKQVSIARQERVRKSLARHLPPTRKLLLRTLWTKMGKGVRIKEFEEAVAWSQREGIAEVEADSISRVNGNRSKPMDFATSRDKKRVTSAPLLRQPGIRLTTITPELAGDLLSFSERVFVNRNLSNLTIEGYSTDMRNGKWAINGDVIRITEEGYVADGQHRLWAVVASEVDVPMYVMHGFQSKDIATVDTGRVRKFCDWLRMEKFTNCNMLQSLVSGVHRYNQNSFDKKSARPTMMGSIQTFMMDSKRYVEAASWCSRFSDLTGCPRNGLGLIHYVLSRRSLSVDRKANLEALESFVMAMRAPVGLTAGHPIIAFLRRMKMQSHPTQKVENVHLVALLIKTWNNTVLDKPVKSLTWKRFGGTSHKREAFPEIVIPGRA